MQCSASAIWAPHTATRTCIGEGKDKISSVKYMQQANKWAQAHKKHKDDDDAGDVLCVWSSYSFRLSRNQ